MSAEAICSSCALTRATAEAFADWSDLVSLALISIAILTNGLDPAHPLWGSPWHENLLNFFTMALLIVFTAFRFIIEGVHSAPAPREFLTISVIYAARWLYLDYTLRRSSAFPYRLLHVARSLRHVVTLRLGTSTHHGRHGAQELVLRRGARKAKGEIYWRGKIDDQEHVGRGWVVKLVEEGMHNDLLSPMGTVGYARNQENSIDDFYRRVYETVMNVEGAGEPHVDWTTFTSKYSAIAKTNLAVRAGATGDGDLPGVARRVAADACLYVQGKRGFRTEAQIELINTCVENAAKEIADQLKEEDGDHD